MRKSGRTHRRNVGLIAAVTAVLLAGAPAAASQATMGNITWLNPSSAGTLIFNQTGTRTSRPACASLDRWVIGVSSAAGQMMASALLTAWSLHKRITVVGNGLCDVWGDTETVSYFVVED